MTTQTLTLPIPETYQPDVQRAVEILKAGGCTHVFLFGSFATGQIRDNPDIDLAIRGCPKGKFFVSSSKGRGAPLRSSRSRR